MRFCIISLLLVFSFYGGYTQQPTGKYDCDCSKIGLDPVWADSNKVSCYMIPVERNFSKPRGKQYLLAVAIAPAISKSPKEPLLYLHGGPGIATLGNMPRYLKSKTFNLLRQDHALVFFDYRGTGFSEPVLCKTLSDSLHAISTTTSSKERITKETSLYADCKTDLLKQDVHPTDFSSLQSASDADAIRAALGLKNIVVYSLSHGTTVALHMMRNFPRHIKAVILDSPFPPNAPWLDFVHPFDTCFKVLEKRIRQDTLYTKLFPSIKNDFIKIIHRLQKDPFAVQTKGKDSAMRTTFFSSNDFAWSVLTAMLDPHYIRLVPQGLKEIAAGNNSVLLHWALLFDDPNSFGEFSAAQSRAILGYETKPRFQEETEDHLLNHFPAFAHLITPGLDASINAVYRPEIPPAGYFDAVISNIPTLIISGEYDPVCPPLFAYITSNTLPNSTVMVVPSASHAALFADDCSRNIGAKFYLDPLKKINMECLMKRKPVEFVTTDILSQLQ